VEVDSWDSLDTSSRSRWRETLIVSPLLPKHGAAGSRSCFSPPHKIARRASCFWCFRTTFGLFVCLSSWGWRPTSLLVLGDYENRRAWPRLR
jgi:hypothetical protein